MVDFLRIAALAKLEPDPEHELASWRDDLGRGQIDDPAETKARLDGYERGDWVVARLDLAVLTADGDALGTHDAGSVPGCWFAVGFDQQNVRHAREMVANNLELAQRRLAAAGLEVPLEQLEHLDVAIAFDNALQTKLQPA